MVVRPQVAVARMTDAQAIEQIVTGLNRMVRPLVRSNVPVPLIVAALKEMIEALETAQRRTLQ